PVLVESGADQLDLGARRRLLGLADAPEQARADEAHEEPQHDDHHEKFNQREPCLRPEDVGGDPRAPPASGSVSPSETRVVSARAPQSTWPDAMRLRAVVVEGGPAGPDGTAGPPGQRGIGWRGQRATT